MSTLILEPTDEAGDIPEGTFPLGLGSSALYQTAVWFIRVRWVIVLFCALAAVVCSLAPGVLHALGVVPPVAWPWALTTVLALANAVFGRMVARLSETAPRSAIEANIRLQTAVDLAAVTVVVYLAGSTAAFVPFFYLFHVTAASVALPRRNSLVVTLSAVVLYLACVVLEITDILPPAGVMKHRWCACQNDPSVRTLYAVSTVFIWLVLWYLLSTLAKAIRMRDRRLEEANVRILKAEAEQNRQVLRTTHDLKVPFSGIESSIQALRLQYWNDLPEGARPVIERIERRAARLRGRMKDILLVGEIRSQAGQRKTPPATDLQEVVREVIEHSTALAASRHVTVNHSVPAVRVAVDRRHLAILVGNLVSNAIAYSREAGTVRVSAEEDKDAVVFTVADKGIGIGPDDLPHIFDDYYRTEEAAEINKMSTGLGLAIVKELADRWHLRIEVTSEIGKGTSFRVALPKPQERKARQEVNEGGENNSH